MSQVFHIHSTAVAKNLQTSKRRGHAKSITLWTIQVLLALLFLFAGVMKLIMPGMDLFMLFIGVAEVAGGLGLILPGLFRIRRGLTPLAAYGLLIIMIGATVITAMAGGPQAALMPALTGLFCVTVAYGRRAWGLY